MNGGTFNVLWIPLSIRGDCGVLPPFPEQHPTAALLVSPPRWLASAWPPTGTSSTSPWNSMRWWSTKLWSKGSADPQGHQLYPGEAQKVLDRLSGSTTSTATLLTNRPLSWASPNDAAASRMPTAQWRLSPTQRPSPPAAHRSAGSSSMAAASTI